MSDLDHQYTPEILMAQYILSAYMLGQRFPDHQPVKGYVDATVRTMLRDLREHGYVVAEEVSP